MKKEEIIQLVIDSIQEVTGLNDITLDTTPHQCNLHSFIIASDLAETINEKTGLHFTGGQIRSLQSFRTLVKMIENRLTQQLFLNTSK